MSPELALALKRTLELLLLPPGGPLLVAILGLWMERRRARIGRAIAIVGILAGLVFSSQGVGQLLIFPYERAAGPALDEAALRKLMSQADPPQAIVILAGGLRSDLHERPDQYRPHPRTVERVLYGAWVARVTGLPILVSGGKPAGDDVSEAELMRRMLTKQLGVDVKWIEDRSLDTDGNARESAALLLREKRRRILLVTHAAHMVRSRAVFEKAGFRPVAAPHGFYGTPVRTGWLQWLPSADGVATNWLALHEMVGTLWYRLRGLL